MGGAPSTASSISSSFTRKRSALSPTLTSNEEEVVKLMFPVYYTPLNVTENENEIAAQLWTLILEDKSPIYMSRKENDPNFHHASCVSYFYDTFYRRLFDIHPLCRPMFKSGIKGQGKFLVNMISFALSQFSNPNDYKRVLHSLAEGHAKKGVRAVEYGIVGEVLFWTLREVLGIEVYTSVVHNIWIKIFCSMLTVIVPVAVAFELKGDIGKRTFETSRAGAAEEYTQAYTTTRDVSTKNAAVRSPSVTE